MGEIIRLSEDRQDVDQKSTQKTGMADASGIRTEKNYLQRLEAPPEAKESEDLCPFVEASAQLAAEKFMDIAIGLGIPETIELIDYLQDKQRDNGSREAAAFLKCIFIVSGQRDIARSLGYLGAYGNEEDGIYELFLNAFMETDIIDRLIIEDICNGAENNTKNEEDSYGQM